jgi:hypothetical protein
VSSRCWSTKATHGRRVSSPVLSVLVTTSLYAIFVIGLAISPLGDELLSIFDQRVTTHHRRQPMTEPTHVPVDLVKTTCPMCGEHIFDSVVPHTIDGAVMASPEMQTEARRLIAEHERTCTDNH